MCVAATYRAKATEDLEVDINSEEMVMENKRRASRRRSSISSASSASAKRTRTYVEHNYTDHYNDPIYVPGENEEEDVDAPKRRGPRGGVVVPFPERLYTMLSQVEDEGYESIVSWQPHGRCFIVHQPKRFVEEVMPKYFRQSKLTSFQRQVNLYGFRRLTAGQDRGAYYHELFLRGRPDLHKRLVRIRVKGTGFKSASSPATEPNFYSYQRCTEDGAKDFRPRADSMDSEMSPMEPTSEPITSTSSVMPPLTAPVSPVWKPLSAPPRMMEFKKEGHESQLTLTSMAHSIALQTTADEHEDPVPITPESNLRQLVSSGLEKALAMVSPIDSPTPSPYPSMLSLADAPLLTTNYQETPAPLPDAVDSRMDSFQEGIQDLLASDLTDFHVDQNLLIENADVPTDYALDPLFLLDDVVCPSA